MWYPSHLAEAVQGPLTTLYALHRPAACRPPSPGGGGVGVCEGLAMEEVPGWTEESFARNASTQELWPAHHYLDADHAPAAPGGGARRRVKILDTHGA